MRAGSGVVRHELHAGTIHEGDWLEAELEAGYTLAILDGPYGMGKGDWDGMSVDELAEWYAPHVARVSTLLAESASLYVWNTEEGWPRIDPVVRGAGWTFRSLIVWDKGIASLAGKGIEDVRKWPSVAEVCGFYQRERWSGSATGGAAAGYAAGRDERNAARVFLVAEWAASGLRQRDADVALGTNGMAGHYFGSAQWSMPTWEAYAKLAAYADANGAPRERPYLVLPGTEHLRASYERLRASYETLLADYEHIRAEYEAGRPAFNPTGVPNVWNEPKLASRERLRRADGSPLHAAQKPLVFAERMIRASTRPGERVLVPFGGTCREAVVCEWLARAEPAEARGYDVCELNADGVDYIGPAIAQTRGEDTRPRAPGQTRLFGGMG